MRIGPIEIRIIRKEQKGCGGACSCKPPATAEALYTGHWPPIKMSDGTVRKGPEGWRIR